MARAHVLWRGKEQEPAVALYMPGARAYVGGEFKMQLSESGEL